MGVHLIFSHPETTCASASIPSSSLFKALATPRSCDPDRGRSAHENEVSTERGMLELPVTAPATSYPWSERESRRDVTSNDSKTSRICARSLSPRRCCFSATGKAERCASATSSCSSSRKVTAARVMDRISDDMVAHCSRPSQNRWYAWSVRNTRRIAKNPPTSSCGHPGTLNAENTSHSFGASVKKPATTAAHMVTTERRPAILSSTRDPPVDMISRTQSERALRSVCPERESPSSVVSSSTRKSVLVCWTPIPAEPIRPRGSSSKVGRSAGSSPLPPFRSLLLLRRSGAIPSALTPHRARAPERRHRFVPAEESVNGSGEWNVWTRAGKTASASRGKLPALAAADMLPPLHGIAEPWSGAALFELVPSEQRPVPWEKILRLRLCHPPRYASPSSLRPLRTSPSLLEWLE
mmetsp:Transcript_57344/g.135398  ORF Transcript_57344/g.135398 Transcript_57344/m.135398 type:complete len:411 (-) Transcript_57344:9-1241(-)